MPAAARRKSLACHVWEGDELLSSSPRTMREPGLHRRSPHASMAVYESIESPRWRSVETTVAPLGPGMGGEGVWKRGRPCVRRSETTPSLCKAFHVP